jgi:hypothetical protein
VTLGPLGNKILGQILLGRTSQAQMSVDFFFLAILGALVGGMVGTGVGVVHGSVPSVASKIQSK